MTTPLSSVPGIDWPALPSAAAAAMLAVQWQLERSQHWPADTLREYQFAQIRELVAHAAGNVPYYRDAPRKAGAENPAGIDQQSFRRWPILRKSDVRANEAALRASRYPLQHGGLSEVWTTGSTGVPLRIVYTELAQFFSHAIFLRDHLLHERDFGKKFAVINASVEPGTRAGWGAALEAVYPTGPLVGLRSSTDIDAQLDWLLAESPDYLMTHASNARALILRSRELGKIPRGIRQVMTQSDMPAIDLRVLARECWRASTAFTYASEECGPIASQCPGYGHYLVHAENVYVEVLRDDGSACEPGEVGRIVVTPLHNFAMPLIRYEIGDFGALGPACPSGRSLPVLESVVGRMRNMAVDPTGRRFWPSFPADLWLSVAPFRQIQIVQREPGLLEVRFVLDRDLTGLERERLKSALRQKLGYPYEFALQQVSAAERSPQGKFEEFMSLLHS